MKSFPNGSRWITPALAVGFLSLYLAGLSQVPFHPDESSWIFMSRDFDTLFLRHDLAAFAWSPGQPITPEVSYRLLDAPLPKYLIGLSWWLSGHTAADPLARSDWDWRLTWAENVAQRHLPAPAILWASRLPSAILAALAAVLIFWIGREARNIATGLLAALLLGFNALLLLHGRRAMAEGVLVFFSMLAVWATLRLARVCARAERWDWKLLGLGALNGASVGLAMASKQTAVVLLPLAALGCAWVLGLKRWRITVGVWLALGLTSLAVFWALNPILYHDPLTGARVMFTARAELVRDQVATLTTITPDLITPTPLARLRAAVLALYLQPLSFSDLPIYIAETAPSVQAYTANPVHILFRQPLAGALLAGLTAAGLVVSGLRLVRTRSVEAEDVCWLWLGLTVGLIGLTTPFDWQRYFVPLVPLGCLFTAFGLESLAQPILRRRPAVEVPA